MQLSINAVRLSTIHCGLIMSGSRSTLGDIHLMLRSDDYTYTHIYLTRQEASDLAIAIADGIVQLDEEARHAAD